MNTSEGLPREGRGGNTYSQKETLSGFEGQYPSNAEQVPEPQGQVCFSHGWLLLDHSETKRIVPAPTVLECSEGCLARCSLSFRGSEQMETELVNKASAGFCHSVAGEEDVQRDTISKQREDRGHSDALTS